MAPLGPGNLPFWDHLETCQLNDDDIAEPHKLCDRCTAFCKESTELRTMAFLFENKMFKREVPYQDTYNIFHHSTLRGIFASAARGCHLCSKVCAIANREECRRQNTSLGQDGVSLSENTIIAFEVRDWLLNGPICAVQVCLLHTADDTPHPLEGHIPILTSSDKRCPSTVIAFPAQLTVSTSSSVSIALAKFWLRNCKDHHSTCNAPPSTSSLSLELPTRLIDIGNRGGDLTPRLYLPDASQATVEYLTLSHRWGEFDLLKLTTENEMDFLCQIPFHDLSPTFQQAMLVTHGLGFRYLWIDSLCIRQNSEEDWKREASRMTAVYANSSCNISALGSCSSSGLFTHRNPLIRFPSLLTVPGEKRIVAHEPEIKMHSILDNLTGDKADLFRRAWVFQERLLAPRNLCFGQQGLYWECCENVSSEIWPYGISPDLATSFKTKFAALWQHAEGWNEEARQSFLRSWHLAVREYTLTDLTYSSDRIIAFSGVAGLIQLATGMTYVAGLWKELIPYDLMWEREVTHGERREKTIQRPGSWRAPSWSWASIDGPVWFGGHVLGVDIGTTTYNILYQAEVVDCQITSIVDRPTALGEVSEGKLVLRGLVKGVSHWQPQEGSRDNPFVAFLDNGRVCTFLPDVESELPEGLKLAFFLFACIENPPQTNYESPGPSRHSEKYTEIGLVLTPYGDIPAGYSRVGVFVTGGVVDWRGTNVFIDDGVAKQEETINIY